MKTFKWVWLVGLLGAFACQKYEVDKDPTANLNNNNEAPQDFSWTTTQDLQTTISFTGETSGEQLAFQLLDENFNRIMKLVKQPTQTEFKIDQLVAGHHDSLYVYIPKYQLFKKVAINSGSIQIGADPAAAKGSPYTFTAGNTFKSNHSGSNPMFGGDSDDDDGDSDDDDGDSDDDDGDSDDDDGDSDDDDGDSDEDDGDSDDDDGDSDDDDGDSDDDDGDSDDDDGDSDDDDNQGDGDDDPSAGSFNYPSSGFAFRAFEDLWPAKGDYDFNDMVIEYRYVATTNSSNQVTSITFDITLPALGAGYKNGLALQLLEKNGNTYTRETNNVFSSSQTGVSIDPADNSVILISTDVFKTIPTYYRNVGDGADGVLPHSFSVTIAVNPSANITPTNMVADLFLYRSGRRGLEVHLPGIPPTAAVDNSLFGTVDDASLTVGFYRGNDNLPWGLELINVSEWDHPLSKVKIWDAYPEFNGWVNSGGTQNQNWFNNPVTNLVYDVSGLPQ